MPLSQQKVRQPYRRNDVVSLLAKDLSQLVEFSADAIIGKDLNGVVTSWNPGAEKIFGYSAAEMIGETLKQIVPASLLKEEAMILRRVLLGESVSHLETTRLRKDGSLIDVALTISPLKDKHGNIVGAFKVARDITERKKTEERLRLLSGALEVAANAIMVTTADGVIEWVNTAFTTSSGYGFHEAVGNNPEVLLKSGKHPASFYRSMWKTISSGNNWHGEIINRNKNGNLYTEDMTITPLKNARGKITHYIAVKLDVTQKKKNEQQILRAQRMESIGTLAGGIAHDLNNILMPIMMCAETLQGRARDKKSREILSTISHSANRGAEMVSQVLSFARGVEGQKIAIEPAHLIQDIEKIILDTFPKNIRIEIQMEKGLLSLVGDPTQLQQVLLNMCVNARDAMLGGGKLSIHASNVMIGSSVMPNPESQPGPYVLIQIEDSGTGVPPSVIDKIFDPFFTTKEIGKGSGLGLSTSMGIVKGHNGFIRVESDFGKGSRFSIYLPARQQPKKANGKSRKDHEPDKGQGETILLVDDEFTIRQTIQQVLKSSGYKVLSASDGAEAISLYLKHRKKIKVVIMDMLMPVMGGSETIQRLSKIDPSVCIVASSGVSFTGCSTQAARNCVKSFLSKPYNSHVLLKTLRFVLDAPHSS